MNDHTDDELLAALGEALADEAAVTDRHRAAARAAFAWRTVDAELMELLQDSAADLAATSSVRASADAARFLSFGHEHLTVELEVEDDGFVGQASLVTPAAGDALSLTLQRPEHPDTAVPVDGPGFFRVTPLPGGPFRLVVAAGDVRLVTPWVTL